MTHDHNYKLVEITKRERSNYTKLLHEMYNHIKKGTEVETPS